MKLPAYNPGGVQQLTTVSPEQAAAPFAAQAQVGGKVSELADKLFNELQDRRDEIEVQQSNLHMAQTDTVVDEFAGMDYIPVARLQELGMDVRNLAPKKVTFNGVEEDAVEGFKVFPELQRKLRMDALEKAKNGITYEPIRKQFESKAMQMIEAQTGRALVTARDQAEAMQQQLALSSIEIQASKGNRDAVDASIELLSPETRDLAKMKAYQVMVNNLAATADDVRRDDQERIALYKQTEAMAAEMRDVIGDEVADKIIQNAATNRQYLHAYVNDVFPRWKGGGGTMTKDQLAAEAPYKMNTPEYKAYIAAVSRLPDEPDPEELRKRYSGGRWLSLFAEDMRWLRQRSSVLSPTDKAGWAEVEARKKQMSQRLSDIMFNYPELVPPSAENHKLFNDAMHTNSSFAINSREAGDPQFSKQIFGNLEMLTASEQATLIGQNMDLLPMLPTSVASGLRKLYFSTVEADKKAGVTLYEQASKEGDIEVILDALGYSRKRGNEFLSDVKERDSAKLAVQTTLMHIYLQTGVSSVENPTLARKVRDDTRKAFTTDTYTVRDPLGFGTEDVTFKKLWDDFDEGSPQQSYFMEQVGARVSGGQPLRTAIGAAYADALAYKPKSTGTLLNE